MTDKSLGLWEPLVPTFYYAQVKLWWATQRHMTLWAVFGPRAMSLTRVLLVYLIIFLLICVQIKLID